MTHQVPSLIWLLTRYNLPIGMLEEYGDVTIAIDIMYINEIPFMMTTS